MPVRPDGSGEAMLRLSILSRAVHRMDAGRGAKVRESWRDEIEPVGLRGFPAIRNEKSEWFVYGAMINPSNEKFRFFNRGALCSTPAISAAL